MTLAMDTPIVPERARYVNAPKAADFTIDQQWSAYSPAEHDRWDRLFERSSGVLAGRVCDAYLDSLKTLELSQSGIPNMADLSERLSDLTGWTVVPVAGLVPDREFFRPLGQSAIPAGAFIRTEDEMEYLEEPDIFHDIFGHVPLLADPTYAAAYLEAYGKGGARALEEGRLQNLARLYWYTVEFGLIETGDGLRLFGAGIMSSNAESVFALEDRSPHRVRFDLERVMRTNYILMTSNRLIFVIDSFEQLLDESYQDFGWLYDRLSDDVSIEPHQLVDGDDVIDIGTLEYFSGTGH